MLSFPQCTVMTVAGLAVLCILAAGVGFIHRVGTFGRLVAPYLLCSGASMVFVLGIAYLDILVEGWIRATS